MIIADEPTGNLDSATGQDVIELLERLSEDEGLSVVLITHDQSIARRVRRLVQLRDGRVVSPEEAAEVAAESTIM